jgi:hypothetical protein
VADAEPIVIGAERVRQGRAAARGDRQEKFGNFVLFKMQDWPASLAT